MGCINSSLNNESADAKVGPTQSSGGEETERVVTVYLDDVPPKENIWQHVETLNLKYLEAIEARMASRDIRGSAMISYVPKESQSVILPQRFLEAVRKKDHAIMRQYISQEGADPNVRDMHGWTALYHAVINNDEEALKYLTEEAGCDINTYDLIGTTPWDHALGRNANLSRHFMDLKVGSNESGDGIQVFLKHFEKSVARHVEEVGMAHFLVISKDDFLKGGEFLHFDKCVDLHQTGDTVPEDSKILFISHRWESSDHPDPEGNQFRLAKEFLEREEMDCGIKWIWLDYSCINQDKTSAEFWKHLQNIPTSIVASSYCLIIPKTGKMKELSDAPFTDIQDYLGRGWCRYEAVGALMTGTTNYVTFSLDAPDMKLTEFVKLDSHLSFKDDELEEEGWQGFKFAAIESLNRNFAGAKKREVYEAMKQVWMENIDEPNGAIARAMVCVIRILEDSKETLREIVEGPNKDRVAQLMAEHHALRVVGKKMGNFMDEGDRGTVACFMLSMVAMCMHRDVYLPDPGRPHRAPASYEDVVLRPGFRGESLGGAEEAKVAAFLREEGPKFFRMDMSCINMVNLNPFVWKNTMATIFSNGTILSYYGWGDSLVTEEYNGTYTLYCGAIDDYGQFHWKGVYNDCDVRDEQYGQFMLSEGKDGKRTLHTGECLYIFSQGVQQRAGFGRLFYDLHETNPFDANGDGIIVLNFGQVQKDKVKEAEIPAETCKTLHCLEAAAFELAIHAQGNMYLNAIWRVQNANDEEEELVESYGEGFIKENQFQLRIFYSDRATEIWHGMIEEKEGGLYELTQVLYTLSPWHEFDTLILGFAGEEGRKQSKPIVGEELGVPAKKEKYVQRGRLNLSECSKVMAKKEEGALTSFFNKSILGKGSI